MVLGVLYTRSVLLSRGGGHEFKELKSPREGAWHLMTFTHHPQPLTPQGREEPASPPAAAGGNCGRPVRCPVQPWRDPVAHKTAPLTAEPALDVLWHQTLTRFRYQMDRQVFDRWLRATELIEGRSHAARTPAAAIGSPTVSLAAGHHHAAGPARQ
jgi:hypothetical protein